MTISDFRGDNGFLSNFYPTSVQYEGIWYPSVEHAFQAAKTLDREQRLAIRSAVTSAGAKTLGRRVTLRDDWEAVKDGVMFELLCSKFNPRDLGDRLAATYPHDLIEGNTWGDTYWGVCNGKGQNKLGQLLMLVRSLILLDRG